MAGSSAGSRVSGRDPDGSLVFFDAECVLCNGSVRWLVRHDRHGRLAFAPLSWLGQSACPRPDSIVLIDAEGEHHESEAALRIASALGMPWNWLAGLKVLPRRLRDRGYRFIAANRITWFGSTSQCTLPIGADAKRFPSRADVTARLARLKPAKP